MLWKPWALPSNMQKLSGKLLGLSYYWWVLISDLSVSLSLVWYVCITLKILDFSRHMSPDKTNKWVCAKRRQISLGIRPVWSESSLSTWRKLGSLATHWAHSKDSDQPGHPLGARILSNLSLLGAHILLVLSCHDSYKSGLTFSSVHRAL